MERLYNPIMVPKGLKKPLRPLPSGDHAESLGRI